MKPFTLIQAGSIALFTSVLAPACAPPDLPCTKDDTWKAICKETPVDSVRGAGGTSGSGGSPSGSGGAMAMDAYPPGPTAKTAVADCPAYPTLGDMDKFFQNRCANTGACHPSPQLFGDYKSPNVWERVTTMKTIGACGGSFFADPSGDHTKGVIWAKTQEKPTCPNGASAGTRMPNPPAMALDAAEMKCLENFLKALKKP
jgi:hypothetical protein